ncbi:glycerol kinase [Occultella glacieicola]|uniref:Glycerol kinase n=1 Tax=Occultella glacieicola TaxID=2518684 RepID=A0ABY2E516_9MICO|nr:FGGY family carbohydrate kinase [Occultella glacieicola]TDE95115.1 glycerol kinase [Occultella glacieicola]
MVGQGVIVAVDQGTSATKAIALDGAGRVVASVTRALGQSHPRPGWVEQDATAILDGVRAAVADVLARVDAPVLGLGLSSQRESALLWDTRSGEPLGPVLGWQDRRTSAAAARLAAHDAEVRERSGLPIDPMFSALKLGWLLDEVDPDRSRSARGEIAAGTVDSWLVHALTGEHRIEIGNASRTQLLNLATGTWDERLLDLFGVPANVLPRVVASTGASLPIAEFGGLRIHAVLGDSHAALYAHGVREPGAVKVTYGTGSSVMGLLTGERRGIAGGAAAGAGSAADPADAVRADSEGPIPAGLVGTIAWQLGDAPHQLAFEGNILATGATIAWLSRLLGRAVPELAALARTAGADHGVHLVPAFAGLGAPWWDPGARAVLSGFDLGTDAAVLARAGAESIAHQVEDVLAAADAAGPVTDVLADGGPSADDWLMQLQADLSGRRVHRGSRESLSACGAGLLAGDALGLSLPADSDSHPAMTTFTPALPAGRAGERREAWRRAVHLTRAAPSGIDTDPITT